MSVTQHHARTVIKAGRKLTCLDRPRYAECGICAHTLEVAHFLGWLEEHVDAYELPLDKMVGTTIPCGSNRNENERCNVRKRTTKPPRDVSQYGQRVPSISTPYDEAEAAFEVVFVSSTRATACYGCKGRVRNKASDPRPPAPNDVFLRHLERPVYRRRGEIKIRISGSRRTCQRPINSFCDESLAYWCNGTVVITQYSLRNPWGPCFLPCSA